jgi:hypothetical protein
VAEGALPSQPQGCFVVFGGYAAGTRLGDTAVLLTGTHLGLGRFVAERGCCFVSNFCDETQIVINGCR